VICQVLEVNSKLFQYTVGQITTLSSFNEMLFGHHKISNGTLNEAVHMVETYFRHRGLDSNQFKLPRAGEFGWWIKEGSATVYIIVQEGNEELRTILRISSPLVYVPERNKEQFYHHLLELNSDLSSCALSVYNDLVLVVSQRPTLGLSQEEMDELVWNAAYVADLLDNKLAVNFGAKLYTEGAHTPALNNNQMRQ
jgi:hypothetical protein